MTKTKEEWEKQRGEAMVALNAIEAKERTEHNRGLLGKCYRYNNSYGSGSRWWLYAQVTGIDRYGAPMMFTFQTCDGDKIEIEEKHRYPSLSSGYTEIPAAEFKKHWRTLQRRIAGISPPKPQRAKK